MEKKIIINADDFGMSKNVNIAISNAFSSHTITDTSLMCTCKEGFEDACSEEYKQLFDGKIGVHLCITCGVPLTEKMKNNHYFCDNNGNFLPRFDRRKGIFLSFYNRQCLYEEFDAQIKAIISNGYKVTHLDSHQHIHFRPAVLILAIKCCKNNNIPYLRITNTEKKKWYARLLAKMINKKIKNKKLKWAHYFGDFKQLIARNVNDYSAIELMVHPVLNSDNQIVDKEVNKNNDECERLDIRIKKIDFSNFSCIRFK